MWSWESLREARPLSSPFLARFLPAPESPTKESQVHVSPAQEEEGRAALHWRTQWRLESLPPPSCMQTHLSVPIRSWRRALTGFGRGCATYSVGFPPVVLHLRCVKHPGTPHFQTTCPPEVVPTLLAGAGFVGVVRGFPTSPRHTGGSKRRFSTFLFRPSVPSVPAAAHEDEAAAVVPPRWLEKPQCLRWPAEGSAPAPSGFPVHVLAVVDRPTRQASPTNDQ